jgi:uracil-DNA glycosylase family 4
MNPDNWVPPDGPKPCRIAIVSDAPAREDVRIRKSLVGPTGACLWPLLDRQAGIYRSECYVTTLSKLPVDADAEEKFPPAEFAKWREMLLEELSEVHPQHILAVGEYAARALLGDLYTTMEACHGRVFGTSVSIVPTWHPAAALRPGQEDLLAFTAWDIKVFGAVVRESSEVQRWRECRELPEWEWDVSPSASDTAIGIDTEGLPEPGVLVGGGGEDEDEEADLDTGDIERPIRHPWSLQWATPRRRTIILASNEAAIAEFREYLAAVRPTVILHNALHDLRVLAAMGVDLIRLQVPWVDTMEKAYLLGTEPKGLKPLAYRWLGLKMRDYESVVMPYYRAALRTEAEKLVAAGETVLTHSLKTGRALKKPKVVATPEAKALRRGLRSEKNDVKLLRKRLPEYPEPSFDFVPLEEAAEYATTDAWATVMLEPILSARVAALGSEEVEQLDLAVTPMFARMEARGLPVDLGKVEELLAEVRELRECRLQETRLLADRDDFNPGSGDQVAAWCEEQWAREKICGLDRLTKSKKRKATDERALSAIQHEHPMIPAILDYRGLQKLEGTFLLPIIEKFGMTGRVHPHWRLTSVKSGRPSTHDPNILAFPSRDALGLKIRGCFVAPDGYELTSVDLSQIEPRMAAILSGDEWLLDVYRSGKDIYVELAQRLFRLPADKIEKKRHRTPTKTVFLGLLYGIGAAKAFEQSIVMGCYDIVDGRMVPFFTVEQMEELLKGTLDVMPGVAAMIAAVAADVRRTGYSSTVLGRKRPLPAVWLQGPRWPQAKLREEAIRAGFNHVIQGSSAEVMKRAMVRMEEVGLPLLRSFDIEVYPLLNQYDEFVAEHTAGYGDVVRATIIEAMEGDTKQFGYPIPIVAEGATGQAWSDLK